MSRSDREYLLARAEQERAFAAQTSDEVARGIHLKLAQEYEVRANILEVSARADNDVLGVTSASEEPS